MSPHRPSSKVRFDLAGKILSYGLLSDNVILKAACAFRLPIELGSLWLRACACELHDRELSARLMQLPWLSRSTPIALHANSQRR